MANKFQSLREGISQERRDRIDAMTREMLAEMPMHALRDALRFTQQQLAEELGVKQAAISKMERRPDHLVSTLRRFIEAMGADLDLKAHFPTGSVSITELGASDDIRKTA
ncbi:MAG: helix-turn-helix transcriptional regulator [Proteobacteria bacterium]|nr:helix-turn-helix transcriptional regulator [Pseudomonadota bacterium]